jgi:hypothetical protein
MKFWPITRRPRRPPRPPQNYSPLAITCDVCGAAPGQPCAPGCCTDAQDTCYHTDSNPAPAPPAEPCPVCAPRADHAAPNAPTTTCELTPPARHGA